MVDAQLYGSIFLSHTGKGTSGKILTRELYHHLKQENPNRRVFFDQTSIKYGANLTDVIKSAIQRCDVFVAIITKQYLQNKWPLLELHWAREYGRPVFAALVEESVDEVKRWVRSDQAPLAWKHIQEAEGDALEQMGHVLSTEALRAEVLNLFVTKVLEVPPEEINPASFIARHLLDVYPDAGFPVDRSVSVAGSVDADAEESPLLRGGRALLTNLEDRAEKMDFLRTEFQRLSAALGNRNLRQVLQSLCCLVEHDAGEVDNVHVSLLDELSDLLDDAELLITKASAPIAPKPLAGRVLRSIECKLHLGTILRQLEAFSSSDRAALLRLAVSKLRAPAGNALAGAAPVVAAEGNAAGAGDTPEAAVDTPEAAVDSWLRSRRRWRPRVPKHLQSQVFQHLDNLVPELAALIDFMPSIGIVGMGGIGKTTIARVLLAMLEHHFDKVVFVAVGQKLEKRKVIVSMWKQLFGEAPRPMPLRKLREQLIRKLNGMRVLLVLDDVRTAETLTYLNFVHMLSGSDNRVIVTSRVRGIFDADDQWHIVQPPALWPEHAQELLCWHAFNTRQPAEGYEEVVRGVVRECQGLPLMLEVTGKSLKGADVAGWRARLQQLEAAEGGDDDVHEQLRARVKWSTDVLPPLTKRCFVLLSMWPKDAALHRQELVDLFQYVCPFQVRTTSEWAEEQVDALHAKCLITDISTDTSSFTMHDILRDVAVQESTKRRSPLLDSIDPDASRHVRTPTWVVRVQRQQARELRLKAPSARWLEVEASNCEKVAGTCKHVRLLRLRKCQVRKLRHVGAGMLMVHVLEMLYCTQLQSLPTAVGSMVHLQRISLDGCAALQSLSGSIGCLHNLQHLSLCGCKALTRMPVTLGELRQLTALMLAECYSLAELPDWVAGLSRLQELDMRSCQSVTELPPRLHVLTNLRKLDVHFCAEPVVAHTKMLMPSLGEHKTMHELLEWYPHWPHFNRIHYFEPEVFVRVLVHLQTVPAARVIVPGGRGEGKSQLCDHVADYFHKVHVEFDAPVFPDGFLLVRLQSDSGGASANGKVSQAWIHEQLFAIHRAIFTRINSGSHDGPVWRYIVSQRDIAVVGHGGNVHNAVTAVKQCIRTLLAGRRLLLLIDDAGPLLPHLFGNDGAIRPSFPGTCVATVSHLLPSAHLPAASAVLPMCTGHAACERILAAAAYLQDPFRNHQETQLREAHKAVGAQVVARLAHNPHAVALLGKLLWERDVSGSCLLEWEAALEALDAAGGGEAVGPLQLAFAVLISCLSSRHGDANGYFLGVLQRLPADTLVPAPAVAALCRAGADDVALEALPAFLEDLKRLLRWSSELKHEQHRVLQPEGCLRVHQCLLDAIESGPTVGSGDDQLMPTDLQAECTANPSDRLVAACVVGVLGTCSHSAVPTEGLVAPPPEEKEWHLNWRAAFGGLGIHPAWLVQLLDKDATLSAGKQLLLSAATGRVWPQLVAVATQVLSHSVRAGLGVLPLLLCRNAAGQVLWEVEHTDAMLVAIRDSSSQHDVVIKLCSALAAREVCAPAAVSVIKKYIQLQHRGSLTSITKGLPDCQLLCHLRGGQFAQVLLQASCAAEGPVMAHTMGAAALGLRRHAAAVTHLQQAHDAFQREYGPYHAATLESGAALGRAHLGAGNYSTALRAFRQVVDGTRCSLWPSHPAAFMAQADVALALKSMGRLRAALRLEDAAQRGLQQQLGSQDPRVAEGMLRCSDTQRRLGRVRAASRSCEQALSLTLPHVLDEASNRSRVLTMYELLQCIRLGCSGLAAEGRVSEALEVQQRVLHAHNSALGEGHRDTLQLLRDIGCSLVRLGRHAEAVGMVFVALKACRARYGDGDPDALQSMQLMTEGLLEMGELREAAAVVAAAQPMVAAEFGQGSTETAWWQGQQDRTAETPHHTTRQRLPLICLIQVLTHEAVVYDRDADALVLQEGQAATSLARLPKAVELLGITTPTHVGAIVGIRIKSSATCDVALVVSQLLALQRLDLEEVHLRADRAQQLADQLVDLSALTGLRFNDNGLGPAGADVIFKVLPSLQQLSELSVKNNDLGPKGTASLALVLPSMTRVTALDIGGNSLGDDGAAALAASLPRMHQLLLLGLRDNDIGVSGMAVLAPSIKAATKLLKLDLALHKMGAQGAQALATALPVLTALTHLDVQSYGSTFGMGAEGMKHVSPQLKKLPLVAHLMLKGNAMGAEGARALADTIPSLTALTFLGISMNGFERDGAAVLGPALTHLSRLEELQLYDDSLNEAEFEPVARALATLPALVRLQVCSECVNSTRRLVPARIAVSWY